MEQLRAVDHAQVRLERGFWHERQEINAQATIHAVYDRFLETGRFDALRFDWKEGMPNKPHIFYDSDVAKWIEAGAYILQSQEDPDLEAKIDGLVDLIVEHQDPNGYFNVWFTVIEPDKRFQLRDKHELYCAGHLFEAAVAYDQARGKDKLLQAMCRYADHIERVFKIERSAAFSSCGHPEVELALIRLYEHTGERRYLDLCRFFLDERGRHPEEEVIHGNRRYAQDHLPVREQATAEGHAVRACYLYCGMADLARVDRDEEMLAACKALFESIVTRRMYITGGIGSTPVGEAFTIDYDLPNETAYAETCAAIALALFARRMLRLDPDRIYADAAETALYNGFLSGVSLDGRSFFYENPLSIDLKLRGRHVSTGNPNAERLPITQRVAVFSCSCCPPNVARFVASIADQLYTLDDARLYVHQYMDGTAEMEGMTLRQQTRYPVGGEVTLELAGAKGRTLCLRIPGWCPGYRLTVDGKPFDVPLERGYARIPVEGDEITVDLCLEMPVTLMEASTHVHADAGKVALQRGPVVYCLEGLDNGEDLDDVQVDANLQPELFMAEGGPLPRIRCLGWRRKGFGDKALYRPYEGTLVPQTLTFIPYYAFANRGETDMRVFVGVRR